MYITLLFMSLGLASDAFAVSITNGMSQSKVRRRHTFATALSFATFQTTMPILGYLMGSSFLSIICYYHHWIALLLLGGIGLNMVRDAYREQNCPCEASETKAMFTTKNLVLQGIATSIDAFAAGISLFVLGFPLLMSAIMIGSITFILCYAGVNIGKKFGSLLGLRAKYLGGIVLIILGIKIFLESFF